MKGWTLAFDAAYTGINPALVFIALVIAVLDLAGAAQRHFRNIAA
jgi:hypothetical protein